MKYLLVIVGEVLTLGVLSVGNLRYGADRVVWADENPNLGEKVYRENCAACHGEKGRSEERRVGKECRL